MGGRDWKRGEEGMGFIDAPVRRQGGHEMEKILSPACSSSPASGQVEYIERIMLFRGIPFPGADGRGG